MANTNSNGYTFGYAAIMTLIVAVALAGVASGLKPIQKKSEDLDKKTSILNAVISVDKTEAEAMYDSRIKEVVVNEKGEIVEGVKAFDIELKKEYRKPAAERNLPLYVYTGEDAKKLYIVPLHGAGLWDEIWGYVAVNADGNTLSGSSFDHKGETPGLGAEITKAWFQEQFQGKKLANESGDYQLVVMKGKGNKEVATNPYKVDGMSGATITGDGVQDMIEKGYNSYNAYFKKNKKS